MNRTVMRSRLTVALVALAASLFCSSLVGAAPAKVVEPSDPGLWVASERDPITVNRIRFHLIHARQGISRVVLPTFKEGRPADEVDWVMDSTIKALDAIRQYSYTDLQVVNQGDYLLQIIPSGSDGFQFRLMPEPAGPAFSTGAFDANLTASTRSGQLMVAVNVRRADAPLMGIEMEMDPGPRVVVFCELPEGGALFAVLTADTPDSPPAILEAATTGPSELQPLEIPESPVAERVSEPVQESDPNQIHMKWDVPPRLVESVEFKYPDIARRAGVEGRVRLHVVVGIDGTVEAVEAVQSWPDGIFDLAAEEAVAKWRYKPAIFNGRPVRAKFSQTLQFLLSPPPPGNGGGQ
jgi:TonB family protein